MKQYARYAGGFLVMGLLSGCNLGPSADMQGQDPREFYAQHPIANKIETAHENVGVHFAAGESRLSPDEIDRLQDQLHGISMMSVETVALNTSKGDKLDDARMAHLKRMLRNMGYMKGKYTYGTTSALKSGDVELDFTYAYVAAPDCPDWRTSPVTTHSNTHQGNFGCSQEVNIGKMVADPHDLVRGTEEAMPIDTPDAGKAIQDYHEGKVATGAGASSSGGGNSGGGSSGGSSSGGSAAGNAGQ